jgi:hypothetical protein
LSYPIAFNLVTMYLSLESAGGDVNQSPVHTDGLFCIVLLGPVHAAPSNNMSQEVGSSIVAHHRKWLSVGFKVADLPGDSLITPGGGLWNPQILAFLNCPLSRFPLEKLFGLNIIDNAIYLGDGILEISERWMIDFQDLSGNGGGRMF